MIEHLVVVAGPSGAGKTTLINHMLANGLPEINIRLSVANWEGWRRETRGSMAKKSMVTADTRLVFECGMRHFTAY